MGQIVEPSKIKLITALLWNEYVNIEEVFSRIEKEWGTIDARSAEYDFIHTGYYKDEFGERLRKQFVSFEKLVDINLMPDIKIRGNELEDEFLYGKNRSVNIDPGYIANAKLVMPTTKNLPHRVYIGNNIYADLQLIYKKPSFQTILWTFADYKEPFNLEFFNKVRERYMEQIASERYSSSGD
jgi:hypothetical protein